ncbi:MAG: TIGR00282 family metallophosphoesterase [Magnetococcales bacterium]|nr:TIGR00282 family metallophosphoesterase [Magnetococcales bacterium]
MSVNQPSFEGEDRKSGRNGGKSSKRNGNTVSILMLGDVVGRPGRRAVREHLAGVRKKLGVDAVIANGENAAAGIGITPATAKELFTSGVDFITTGNHVWRHREVLPYLDQEVRLIRPRNYPPGAPGRGYGVFQIREGVRIGVLNLQGRVFMDPVDCPFRSADSLLKEVVMGRDLQGIIVDFHAEATSEKVAMGFHLDGRVSAVLGTHTHIPTADGRVLPGGTAYQTDIGMTGCYDSVIGMRSEGIIERFLTCLPRKFEPVHGNGMLTGALVRLDAKTGRCQEIRPLRRGAGLPETDYSKT